MRFAMYGTYFIFIGILSFNFLVNLMENECSILKIFQKTCVFGTCWCFLEIICFLSKLRLRHFPWFFDEDVHAKFQKNLIKGRWEKSVSDRWKYGHTPLFLYDNFPSKDGGPISVQMRYVMKRFFSAPSH